jgi:ribose transport system ATP-binding protein
VQGLALDHSIERNITLPRLRHLARWGWIQSGLARRRAAATMKRLAIKARAPSTLTRTLSGGNQQKVVFAKWREPRPRLLLLDEPTVGVDVRAREEIYEEIRQVVAEGAGALVVSSDLAELIELCDRISLIVDGRVARVIARGEAKDAEVLHHLLQMLQSPEAAETQEANA